MSLALLGFGAAAPDATLTQDEALAIARVLCCRAPEDLTWLPVMYGQTGIGRRHTALGRDVIRDVLDGTRHSGSVFLPKELPDDPGPTTAERMGLYRRSAVPLALDASAQALSDAGVAADAITHLVTVSCTGFFSPGVDFHLIDGLGLKATVARTHVGFMGCHAAINGLRVAQAYAEADPAAKVLLCAVELSSLHYHYGWDPQKIVANALFGDGAAAVVAGAGSAGKNWQLATTGSCLFPNSADAMTWNIGDRGFEMTLAKNIPGLIARNLRAWLEPWLHDNELSLRDVKSWAVHPGGPKILSAVEEALGLPPEATAFSREVLHDFGNMSSPTVLFIIDRLRSRNAPCPAVALAFGPGLAAEAALFR